MKKIILISVALIIVTNVAFSQGTAINTTGAKADSSAILDLSSTTKGMLVPRMLKAEKLAISNPANGLLIYQTDDTTGFWYFNSVKWVQAVGPSGSSGGGHYIGELYGGGIIVGVWKISGVEHGLIASVEDVGYCTWSTVTSTQVPAPGARSCTDGLSNSNAIVTQAGGQGNYAASLCRSYYATGDGGNMDWYLPASWELMMCFNAAAIVNIILGDANGFQYDSYWTSTEWNSSRSWNIPFFGGDHMWNQDFGFGSPYYNEKSSTYKVRAVRRF